ncbi:MAG: hypothetical protein NC037_00895 [Bacteroides sp.]|nr:hypothetical protein [Bacillota bacterium]MCM1393767.1 hypothetical protein [[Eubacterium] siraeum]MCM1455076.1 hypothetical protein [Bacteroides sp.]
MSKKKKNDVAEQDTPASEESGQHKPAASKQSDYGYVVKNKKARAATRHRKAITIVGIILLILLLLAGGVYLFYSTVQINNFKIFIESSGGKILSLSPHSSMVPGSEMIEIVGPDKMTNTTFASGKNIVNSMPIEDRLVEIVSGEGSITNVDDFFIAGTFYMKNITNEDKIYGERVSFDIATKGAQTALRVMLIRNDEIIVYASPKTDKDGNYIKLDAEGRRILSDDEGFYYLDGEDKIRVDSDGELQKEEVVPLASGYKERQLVQNDEGEYSIQTVEDGDTWMTEFFYSDEYAVYNDGLTIAAGEKVKYSIIIWFEGWDSDCVDKIVDGQIQLSLSFACN